MAEGMEICALGGLAFRTFGFKVWALGYGHSTRGFGVVFGA